jgi:hypothetical protein
MPISPSTRVTTDILRLNLTVRDLQRGDVNKRRTNVSDYPIKALRCKISRGAFSSQRVFKLQLANGDEYVGIGPSHYFYNDKLQRLPKNEPAEEVSIDGFVAARILSEDDQPKVLINIPSGDFITILQSELENLPAEQFSHVPVES